jgi:hypothetical protein
MYSNDVCPFDNFVNARAVLQRNGVPDVGELPVFENQEVVVLG